MVAPDKTNDEIPPVEPKEGEDPERKSSHAEEAPLDDKQDSEPAGDGDNGKARAAPQAQPPESASSRQESMETVDSRTVSGELQDCYLSPLADESHKNHLADEDRAALAAPPLHDDGHDRPSALHHEEYRGYDDQHHPRLEEGIRPIVRERPPPFDAHQRKTRDRRGGQMGRRTLPGGAKHSNPRKTPYRSEVARIRHAQRLEREAQAQGSRGSASPADDASQSTATSRDRTISLKQTTAPPPTASFSIQSSRFKHMVLNSLGEFLTSAFSDDEESSGSYFSQELLDQLSASDPRLRGVWLQAKSLNDDHVRQLCESLVVNKVVTEVWLPSNYITDVGASHLAHMLKFNKSIRELFLGGNDIGPRGAAALAGALARGNATLVALGLGDNHIGVEGAGALAAALRHNHTLHTLDVKGNNIPRRSSVRRLLSKMLEFNASDPGDETLVLGLQDELTNLVSRLDPKEAEAVVLRAEEALTTAMVCRRRGDRVGAAEAEGAFIRICTTGSPPADPPEREGSVGSAAAAGRKAEDGEGQGPREPKIVTAEERGIDAPESIKRVGSGEGCLPQEDGRVQCEEEVKGGVKVAATVDEEPDGPRENGEESLGEESEEKLKKQSEGDVDPTAGESEKTNNSANADAALCQEEQE